jgi:molybdopterin-binding protein
MKTLTKMKKVCCFNRFVLFAMALSIVSSFTACSSDDDDSNIPVYSLKDVDGTYSGTMLTESEPVNSPENAKEGEKPAGAEVTAEVKDNQIMIKKLPVDDLIKSIIDNDEVAEGIIANLGEINYNISYTPTFDENKNNILLQLKPEPLEIKFIAPVQAQEEGEEPAEILITVTIQAEKNGAYTYEGKKLAFIIKATEVKIGEDNYRDFPITTFTFSMVKK